MDYDFKQIEKFFYYQNNEYVIILEIDYQKHFVRKINNCLPDECLNDKSIQSISRETAMALLEGLHRLFFLIQELNYENKEPSKDQIRKFTFFDRINRKISNPIYNEYILEEYRLFDLFKEKRMKFTEVTDRHNESIRKCNPNILYDFLKQFIPDENIPERERMRIFVEVLKNGKNNGYEEVRKKLYEDKNYIEANELSKQLLPAYIDFLKALIEVEKHQSKEYELYTDKYKKKLSEYADKGLFLYCQNTPDLPIDDDDITIDDIYNYFSLDNYMYLKDMFETYIDCADAAGEINKREADDLIASFNLLIEGKYWASLRNLYALIDHHHKLCSEIFNGYENMKIKFVNGKQRAEYIDDLFNQMNVFYYEDVWHKINDAIEEINKGSGNRFVSRNAIIHGDYEKIEVNPNAKDVINVFLLYVTMRQMIDHLANIEEAAKNYELYYLGYKINFQYF